MTARKPPAKKPAAKSAPKRAPKSAAQPRIAAGDPRRGRIHPGEFAAAKEAERGARGRKGGAPVPGHAPIHLPPSDATSGGGAWAAEVKAENETRMADEMVGDFDCRNCGWKGWREHPVVGRDGKWHATLAFQGCTRCGTLHPSHVGVSGKYSPQHSTARPEAARPTEVDAPTGRGGLATRSKSAKPSAAKTVDTGETALQAQDLEAPAAMEYVGHRANCPRGGESPCGKDVDGRCAICDVVVEDHQALGKTIAATVLDLRKLAQLD